MRIEVGENFELILSVSDQRDIHIQTDQGRLRIVQEDGWFEIYLKDELVWSTFPDSQ